MGRDMTSIKVPYLGRIEIAWGRKEVRSAYGARYEHLVRFLGNRETGARHDELYRITVGQPLKPGGNPRLPYRTVSAAFAFLREDENVPESFSVERWERAAEIPIGRIKVAHPNGSEREIKIEAPIDNYVCGWVPGILDSRRIGLPHKWRDRASIDFGDGVTWTLTVDDEIYTLSWRGEILNHMREVRWMTLYS